MEKLLYNDEQYPPISFRWSRHFNKIATINGQDLSCVVEFLEFFYKLIKFFEESNSPTKHKIVPSLAAIKKHCELTRINSIVSEYADQTKVQIKTKFITDSEGCPLKYSRSSQTGAVT